MADDSTTPSESVGDPPATAEVVCQTEENKTEGDVSPAPDHAAPSTEGPDHAAPSTEVSDQGTTDHTAPNDDAPHCETVDQCTGPDSGIALAETMTEEVKTSESSALVEALEELAAAAAGSDSGVEGCGRALSSAGGSRSCASSVVSCGSGCGSESSGLGPARRRRPVVTLAEPRRPPAASTPRPATAPRGPNLATRERARSREKPVPPEKPRPLTPKPRIRPTGDLPHLVRESPALRAKPTRTSTARCRTPSSPEERRWGAGAARGAGGAGSPVDKYGSLGRRRREDAPSPPAPPAPARRPALARSASSRSTTKTRVRIYAEKNCQTVLIGADIESALGGITPNIESRTGVHTCSRGVQASARDAGAAAAARAEAQLTEERARRRRAEQAAAEERAGRLAAHEELQRNSHRLLELAGAGAGAGADGCLRALEEQLKASGDLASRQRAEIDSLRALCDKLHMEASQARASSHQLEERLSEATRDAAEMQDFLAAEARALADSLRDAEAQLADAHQDLAQRRAECRQLVRISEQRRQEALAAARGAGGAGPALDALAARLRALTAGVARAYCLPQDQLQPTVFHNQAYSRSDSGEALSIEDDLPRGGLLAAVAKALRTAPAVTPAEEDKSRASEDNDISADLLDSETEPCLVTDPECAEEWWSGAENAWSGSELSPVRDEPRDAPGEARDALRDERDERDEDCSVSERESLRNLSAAIANRQRSEAEDVERGSLLDRVLSIDNRLTELLRALRLAAAAAAHSDDADSMRLANALRDKLDVTEKNVADVVVAKLAELDASRRMLDQYRGSVESAKVQDGVNPLQCCQLLRAKIQECTEFKICSKSSWRNPVKKT
ncbi:uncharacterized protein LOC119693644 isoform X2 [Plutella xylostella]|uniref:uncharacterized protein LOC119693644 isoform X2 n=1 Tax=Plutella xylostella TaxID=51655 RepID=UPI002032AB9B|nr:uncharacterized protein LOC119693644 isoform X2 [Plutella xylostella]